MPHSRSSSSSSCSSLSPPIATERPENQFFKQESMVHYLSPASSSNSSCTSSSSPRPIMGCPDSIDGHSVPLLFHHLISPFRLPSTAVPLPFDSQLRKMISLGSNDQLSFHGLYDHWLWRKMTSHRRPGTDGDDEDYRIKQLIAIALYTSRWGRLKLQQIISHIEEAYPRTYGPEGTKDDKWKDTIRNKLSYYGMFVKCKALPGQKEDEKPISNHGGYWGLDPYDETTSKSRRMSAKAAVALTVVPDHKPKSALKKVRTKRKKTSPTCLSSISPSPLLLELPLSPRCVEAHRSSPPLSTAPDSACYYLSPQQCWSPESLAPAYQHQSYIQFEWHQPSSPGPESLFVPDGYVSDPSLHCIDPMLLEFDKPPRELSHNRRLRTRLSSRKTDSPYSR
ncbi:hypothetical protein D9619_004749 [Psilocybe cf. subviscida]|uniref:Fork-head domain-containing protein n=1 Tax=Psilocybe cf. subviscida TaxID=2480587 RepID=A0A8H5BQN7_9AGAR|nr:hypothetical protein D9619_004749 [Psilocybe cf. subviscida]